MAKLKLDWGEFVGFALKGIKEKYPRTQMSERGDIGYPEFVKRSGSEERDIAEEPDYVYIDLQS